MGRMLEALARGRTKLALVEDPTPIVIHQPIITRTVEGEAYEENDQIPFIEVGGPNREPITNLHIKPVAKPISPPVASPIPEAKPPILKSTWSEKVEGSRYLSILFQPVVDYSIREESRHAFTSDMVAFHRPDHPISDQYRALMKQIDDHREADHKALFFTSPHTGSGTTTVVLNLAVVLLHSPDKHLLVIDANPAQSSVAERLGVASSPGMHELLHRQLPIGVTIQRSVLPGLSVLPAGRGEGVRGTVDRDRVVSILKQLSSRYDWILIDGPEWGDESISVWASLVDSAYLVVRQTDTDHPEVELAHQVLQQGGKLKGYIMTRG